jgi:hypothetical protein
MSVKVTPEFIRMPEGVRGARCPLTGLSRAYLYLLAKQGLIETRQLTHKGGTRGVRLIRVSSLLAYIERASTVVSGERKEAM